MPSSSSRRLTAPDFRGQGPAGRKRYIYSRAVFSCCSFVPPRTRRVASFFPFPIISALAAHTRCSVTQFFGRHVARCISAPCYAVQVETALLLPCPQTAVQRKARQRLRLVLPWLHRHIADLSARLEIRSVLRTAG